MVEWKEEKRRQTKPGLNDDEPPEKEAVGQENWKALGPDGIPGFWSSVRRSLVDLLWKIYEGQEAIPHWLVHKRTVMIPKAEGVT